MEMIEIAKKISAEIETRFPGAIVKIKPVQGLPLIDVQFRTAAGIRRGTYNLRSGNLLIDAPRRHN